MRDTEIDIPSCERFIRGCEEFRQHEPRDAMYKVATFLVSYFWGNFSKMADGLGVLLLTWNQAFYRFGGFDFNKLEKCIKKNFKKIERYRNRDISSLSNQDENDVKDLFNEFLEALQIASGKMRGRKSPVAVAKTLHLLAPKFFPLWDDKIARAYGCYYDKNPAEKYVLFCKKIKLLFNEMKNDRRIKNYSKKFNKTLLKLIDEYNYSKCTQGWI